MEPQWEGGTNLFELKLNVPVNSYGHAGKLPRQLLGWLYSKHFLDVICPNSRQSLFSYSLVTDHLITG